MVDALRKGVVVMVFSVSIGIDNRVVRKWGSVMRTTRCRLKLHTSPLVGGLMLDELSNLLPRAKIRKEGKV